MIYVKNVRKHICKKSSDRVRLITGECGFYRAIKNGLGKIFLLKKPVKMKNKQKSSNCILDSKLSEFALFSKNVSGINISNVTILNAKTAFLTN